MSFILLTRILLLLQSYTSQNTMFKSQSKFSFSLAVAKCQNLHKVYDYTTICHVVSKVVGLSKMEGLIRNSIEFYKKLSNSQVEIIYQIQQPFVDDVISNSRIKEYIQQYHKDGRTSVNSESHPGRSVFRHQYELFQYVIWF